jgi:transcriptional regulator with XRE-family HTH domain/predicted nucleotidyltransferase/energy-coupling factor transporter ATP-binding protein EcfA2
MIISQERLRSVMKSKGFTQSQLARTSGVSRVQLSRLLSKDQPHVRNKTVERLALALSVNANDLALGGRIRVYRESVSKEYANVDFRGFGMPEFKPQPISEVFVDPEVVEVAKKDDRDQCSDAGPESKRSESNPTVRQVATEAIRSQDRVVVIGDPGSGKTTMLRFLAHAAAGALEENSEVPFYIRLAEFSRAQEIDERTDLAKFMTATAAARASGPQFEEPLRRALADEQRHCLVLLDGLDEVGDERRRERVVESVRSLVEQYPRNRFVISSRVVGFDRHPWENLGFAIFKIRGYGENQLGKFAEKWAAILARDKSRPEAEVHKEMMTAICSNARVRALASNPLVLTILVLLNESRGGTLPKRRVDLYAKVIDVFLDTWERSKRTTETFDEAVSIDLDAREFRWLLSDLALAMQKAGRTLAARWWVTQRTQGYLQEKLGFGHEEAKDTCDRIIRYLVDRAGLLDERGLDLFGFSHRTLQEYFASLGIIDETDASRSRSITDLLRSYLFHPEWSEVTRLVAAQVTPPVAESLISVMLDDPDPVGRFLRRGPILALKCLSDGTTIPNRTLVITALKSLEELGRSKWLGITLEALDALDEFEGSRIEDLVNETVNTILKTAKRELDEEEYACLSVRVHGDSVLDQISDAPPNLARAAILTAEISVDGRSHHVLYVNGTLLSEMPAEWYRGACAILDDPQQSLELKTMLVSELGRRVATDTRARRCLFKVLRSGADGSLRASCAGALARFNSGRQSTKRFLLDLVNDDPDERVRGACATALRDVAMNDSLVRARLLHVLRSREAVGLRAAAARGLAKAASADNDVAEALLQYASREHTAKRLRIACAWALEGRLGRDMAAGDAFKSWLDAERTSDFQRVVAQILADAIAEEKLAWDHRVVERVEQILMNLANPCPHALASLESLATAREVRHGLRLENVLRDNLAQAHGRIELAFVFGSTARSEQTDESDIDLMLIGDVTLKNLSTPLSTAERTLGRRINPVIYTRQIIEQRYKAGDPFLADVYRRDKIPILPAGGSQSRKDLDNELRAMVAERLA